MAIKLSNLASRMFAIKGGSALLITSAVASFIGASSAFFQIILYPSDALAWVILALSTATYLFATAIIIADIKNRQNYS